MTAAVESLFVRREPPLKRYLIASLVAHGVLLAAALLAHSIFGGPTIDLDQKPITAKLVRLGHKRDPKFLPRKDEPPPPSKAQPAPLPAPVAPKPTPAPKAPPAKPAKVEGQKKGVDPARQQLFGAFNKLKKEAETEGDENGDPNGDAAEAEGEKYWALLSTRVHRNYDVSQTISDDERIRLKAQVALFIGRTGQVLKVRLVHSSGNPLFDNAVLAAVKKASPFAPPPDKLRRSLESTGVVLEFTP
jgi:TonB family protein